MTGQTLRFINFLLDTAIYFIVLTILMVTFKDIIPIENVKWISCLLYFSYYFLFEYFKGQTIGKIITKSQVISTTTNNDNYLIRIFFRTLMRLIPIDIISYIFTSRGLHDRISMTSVIRIEQILKPK